MTTGDRPGGAVSRALLAVIGWYQRALSPVLGPRCRFHPTCSAYAAEAVAVHGAVRGLGLSVVRILKCAPWHSGGVDLVPPLDRVPPSVPVSLDRPDRATSPAHAHRTAHEESGVA